MLVALWSIAALSLTVGGRPTAYQLACPRRGPAYALKSDATPTRKHASLKNKILHHTAAIEACANEEECLLLEADKQLQIISACSNKAQGGQAMKQRLQAAKRVAELRELASNLARRVHLHEKLLSRLLNRERFHLG